MPLYEYSCPQCGRFETIQKFSDAPILVCPTCGRDVQRLLSAPAIQFKGSGWYVTDYARKSSGGDGAESSASSKSKDAGAKDGKGSKDSSSGSPNVASKDASSSGGSPSK